MSHQFHSLVVTAVPAADIWTKLGSAAVDAKTALITVGGAIAVAIIIYTFWKAKGAIAALVGAGVVAMVFIWFLNNVDNGSVQNTVTDTVVNNGMGPLTTPQAPRDQTLGS